MDPVLQQARETLLCSQEWEDLNRELLSQLQHLEHLHGEGKPRSFSNLTDVEKVRVVGMAAGLLEKTKAFSELQAKVSTTVSEQMSPVSTRPALARPSGSADGLDSTAQVPSSSELPVKKVSRACSHLLLEGPYLVHHLKKCFNRPFPPGLRAVAWRVLLQHVQPTVKNDFLATVDHQVGYVATTPEETRISHWCSETLSSNPVYRDVANSPAVLRAMTNIMLYWSRRSGSTVSDAELAVCIPFLYVRREELSEQFGKAQDDGLSTISEIATQCVRFMKMLPLTMHSVAMEQVLEAMNEFSLEVERLLSSEDPVLYRALQKVFGQQTAATRAPSAISQESQLPFHKRLSNIIQPHIRRMLVGDVSMEVLCFIWDQCFIGWDTPGYRFMPHAIVVWLILLKDRLMSCHSTKDIERALAINSATLTIRDFQKELRSCRLLRRRRVELSPPLEPGNEATIEKRFLHTLSSQLRITPLKLKRRNSEYTQRSDLSNRSGLGLETGECEPTLHEGPEKELPRSGIAGLQRQLEEDHQSLLNAFLKEKEDHKKEMAVLRREVAALKMKAAELSVSKSVSQTSETRVGVTAIPTNSTVLSPSSTTENVLVSPEQRAQMDVPVSIPVNQNAPRVQGQDGGLSVSSQPKRPYSPLHLTETDIQDIWLKLLGCFTAAAYTVCHGTGEEKHQLYASSTTLEET